MTTPPHVANAPVGGRALAQTTAVILAGGLGTRLHPIVADRPKVLAPVAGQPFLTYLLNQLEQAGVRRVVLCTGYRGDQVWRQYRGTYGSMTVAYSHEQKPLGTAGALRKSLPLMLSDQVLVLNGDSYCDVDLGAFLTSHVVLGAAGSLVVLARSHGPDRYGRVHLSEDGRVDRFEEKMSPPPAVDHRCPAQEPARGPEVSVSRPAWDWINAGIYLLSTRLISGIPVDHAVSLEREMFPAWTKFGLFGFPSNGRFIDIGTPDSYREAQVVLSDLAWGGASPAPNSPAPDRRGR